MVKPVVVDQHVNEIAGMRPVDLRDIPMSDSGPVPPRLPDGAGRPGSKHRERAPIAPAEVISVQPGRSVEQAA